MKYTDTFIRQNGNSTFYTNNPEEPVYYQHKQRFKVDENVCDEDCSRSHKQVISVTHCRGFTRYCDDNWNIPEKLNSSF